MANRKNQKLKLLMLEKIFNEKTDETHGLTMAEILDELAKRGIETERKSVYTSINALREAGLDIEKRSGAAVTYGLSNRAFKSPEILMIIDAVRSSSFLSEAVADSLTEKLIEFAPEPSKAHLKNHAELSERPKSINEQSISNIDVVMRANAAKKQIKFNYFFYNTMGKPSLCRNGSTYTATPLQLVYTEGRYFLVAYDEDLRELVNYRVDHMLDLEMTDKNATVNQITKSYVSRTEESIRFDMSLGEVVTVSLLVKERSMNNIIDKFGTDLPLINGKDGTTHIHARVVNCPAFYGWILKQGTGVVIEKPKRIVETYKSYLRASLDLYGIDSTEF